MLKSKKIRQEASCFARIGRNILVAYRSSICTSHFIIEDKEIRFVNNFWFKSKVKGGILSICESLDEMHLGMSVEVEMGKKKRLENFMFNLSILSTDKKFINPFMRMSSMGLETS